MSNKFKMGSHFCNTPWRKGYAGRVWTCAGREGCGAVFKVKEVKGRLVWLQTRDGRNI